MARKKTVQTETEAVSEEKTMTRKEKTAADKANAKAKLLEVLKDNNGKRSEIIDKAGERSSADNGLKGLLGIVFDEMEKKGEIVSDGGMYALKSENAPVQTEEKPSAEKATKAKRPARKKKAEAAEEPVKTEEPVKEAETPAKAEEAPAPKKSTRGRKKKTEEPKAEEPVKEEPKTEPEKAEPATETLKEEPVKEEPKAEPDKAEPDKAEPAKEEPKEQPKQEPKEQPKQLVVKQKAEVAKKEVSDLTFLFGNVKPKAAKTEPVKEAPKAEIKPEARPEVKTEQKPVVKAEAKLEPKAEVKEPQKTVELVPAPVQPTEKPVESSVEKQAEKPVQKQRELPQQKPQERKAEPPKNEQRSEQPKKQQPAKNTARNSGNSAPSVKEVDSDEKLKEAFIDRLHKLGGTYFEYYSVYLLERYSRRYGNRLEGLKVSGGDRDGGIDGEIELTSGHGFRETIYIQAKNWNVDGTNKRMKMVGETVLQQFVGACMWRQAKDGKQNCRGIFMTLTEFTPESKRLLAEMQDKIVGYDATDIFEAAKECEFGIIRKNGEWALDEKLLSGEKAFFFLY